MLQAAGAVALPAAAMGGQARGSGIAQAAWRSGGHAALVPTSRLGGPRPGWGGPCGARRAQAPGPRHGTARSGAMRRERASGRHVAGAGRSPWPPSAPCAHAGEAGRGTSAQRGNPAPAHHRGNPLPVPDGRTASCPPQPRLDISPPRRRLEPGWDGRPGPDPPPAARAAGARHHRRRPALPQGIAMLRCYMNFARDPAALP